MQKTGIEKILKTISVDDECHPLIEMIEFDAWFEDHQVLNKVNLSFDKHQINCIVGPSGGGKSTLIRSINRINDEVDGYHVQGDIQFGNTSIFNNKDATGLRTRIGMVFQKPCVFPKSIEENILFGLRFGKKRTDRERSAIVEEKLKAVALWDEVKHRLSHSATALSIGQQQRLCIARTLAVDPEVLLLDEPTSSLDPVSSRAIEDLILQLKDRYTIIFVTHNILQARRIADQLIFICDGRVIEQGSRDTLFNHPQQRQTWEYLNNEFCQC